jgi:hypothetical protein
MLVVLLVKMMIYLHVITKHMHLWTDMSIVLISYHVTVSMSFVFSLPLGTNVGLPIIDLLIRIHCFLLTENNETIFEPRHDKTNIREV